MIRLVIALTGLAVFAALFAGIYYSTDDLHLRQSGGPAFRLAAGEVEQTTLQPALAGSGIVVEITTQGTIDLYVLEKEWSDTLPRDGRLVLDRPFSYDAAHSLRGLNGTHEFTLVSDGLTSHLLVFDNSDNFYDNDTAPDLGNELEGGATVQIVIRYVEAEERSLLLGYLATVPSILLVAITLARKVGHVRRERQQRGGQGPAQ